jgi:hypothetical protein
MRKHPVLYTLQYQSQNRSHQLPVPFLRKLNLSGRGFRTFNKVDIDILNKTTYSLWLNFAALRVALSKKWLLRS